MPILKNTGTTNGIDRNRNPLSGKTPAELNQLSFVGGQQPGQFASPGLAASAINQAPSLPVTGQQPNVPVLGQPTALPVTGQGQLQPLATPTTPESPFDSSLNTYNAQLARQKQKDIEGIKQIYAGRGRTGSGAEAIAFGEAEGSFLAQQQQQQSDLARELGIIDPNALATGGFDVKALEEANLLNKVGDFYQTPGAAAGQQQATDIYSETNIRSQLENVQTGIRGIEGDEKIINTIISKRPPAIVEALSRPGGANNLQFESDYGQVIQLAQQLQQQNDPNKVVVWADKNGVIRSYWRLMPDGNLEVKHLD